MELEAWLRAAVENYGHVMPTREYILGFLEVGEADEGSGAGIRKAMARSEEYAARCHAWAGLGLGWEEERLEKQGLRPTGVGSHNDKADAGGTEADEHEAREKGGEQGEGVMDAGKGLLSAAAGLLKAGRKSAQPLLENYLVDPRSGKSIKVPGITSRRNTEIHNKFPAVAGVEPGGLMFGRAEDIQGWQLFRMEWERKEDDPEEESDGEGPPGRTVLSPGKGKSSASLWLRDNHYRGGHELFASSGQNRVFALRKIDDKWESDRKVHSCRGCKVAIGKQWEPSKASPHHCRKCGRIFCRDCARWKYELPQEEGNPPAKERVCEGCYDELVDRGPAGAALRFLREPPKDAEAVLLTFERPRRIVSRTAMNAQGGAGFVDAGLGALAGAADSPLVQMGAGFIPGGVHAVQAAGAAARGGQALAR